MKEELDLSQTKLVKEKKNELTNILNIFGKQLSVWSQKNKFLNLKFIFKVDYKISSYQSDSLEGCFSCSEKVGELVRVSFNKSAFNCDFIKPIDVCYGLIKVGMSKDGFQLWRNVILRNFSIPSFYQTNMIINEEKDRLYRILKCIVDGTGKPIGILLPLEEALTECYSDENVLGDLMVRNFYFHRIYLKFEKEYRKKK